jgi:hypothetical protein
MKTVSGKEMRKLMWAISVMVVLLVLAIVTYFIIDVTVTTNHHISENRDRLVAESVRTFQDMKSLLFQTDISQMGESLQVFNQEMLKGILAGDLQALYDYAANVILTFYPVEYAGFIMEGELTDYAARRGVTVDPSEMPTQPPESDYVTMDRLGDREGFFVSVFVPLDLKFLGLGEKEFLVNLVIDRTEGMREIETYFHEQRNDLLVRMLVAAAVALIASLLVTTFGLRYFTRKYVVHPIEKINRQAREIMEGTFTGEVEVDENSAYAALQGLLRSGQKVLSRMDEELRG